MLVLAFVLFPAPLFAIISISIQSVPGSRPLVGGGPVAVLNFGTVSAFEALASGVNRTIGASDYTISTGFGIRVTKIVGGSSSYTLQARHLTANPLTWEIDGVTMTTTPVTVATLLPYGQTIPHTLGFDVPFSFPAGVVTTVIEVTAIAN